MQAATQELRKEHEAILKMLDVAATAARCMDAGEQVRPEILTGLMEFFRTFADKCHHGKEEDQLFPLLEKKGISRERGPIGCMLEEHAQGRALIRQMVQAADEYVHGDVSAGTRWSSAAGGYVDLLRAHIEKENYVLFVMAERVLTEDEQNDLFALFEKFEKEQIGEGTHERLHRLMHELAAQVQGKS